MKPPASPAFRAAAIAYALYGLLYLGGAVVSLTPERRVTFFGLVPWWAFYVLGLALIAAIPPFIWRGVRWLTRLLALGVGGKALALCLKQSRLMESGEGTSLFTWFFLAVAVVTAVLLARAGLAPRPPVAASGGS